MDDEKRKCRCYVTYSFLMDDTPPLPFPNSPASAPPSGFEPTWFLNARFPEDEEWEDEE